MSAFHLYVATLQQHTNTIFMEYITELIPLSRGSFSCQDSLDIVLLLTIKIQNQHFL